MPTTTAPDDDVVTAPLNSFAHCHEGIVQKLQAFEELPALLEPAARARQLASDTLAFFHGPVFDHHREEEKDLFPAVLAHAQAGTERGQVEAMVEELTAEHRDIEAMWRQLQPQLELVARGTEVDLDTDTLRRLVQTYKAHAQWEEAKFLPLCKDILGRHSGDLAALGLALHTRHVVTAARRGLRGS